MASWVLTRPPRSNALAPKAAVFGQNTLGLVAIRTGWGPGQTAITYKAGDFFDEHGHYDQGTFTIFRNAPLVINSGGYGDDSGTHRLNYYIRTVAANSILIMRPGEAFPQDGAGTLANDGGQRIINATGSAVTSASTWLNYQTPGQKYDLADIRKYESVDGAYTYIDSDLTNAYNTPVYDRGNVGGKVSEVARRVMWLADCEALVIFDRVTTTNPGYRKKWLLHTPNKPAGGAESVRLGTATDGLMVVDGSTIPGNTLTSVNGGGKLFHQILLPSGYQVNKVGGPDYRWYVETDGNDDNGYNGTNQDGGYTPQPWNDSGDWRTEVTPVVPQLSDTFLNVLWPRDASATGVPAAQILRNDDLAAIVQVGTAVAGFATHGTIDADLTYTLTCPAGTVHRLADMLPGAPYYVLCGGTNLQQVRASQQGVLQFTDPVAGPHGVTVSQNTIFLPADINQDGSVDVLDLLALVASFGALSGDPAYDPACDLNADGSIDVIDLLIFVESFGMAQVRTGTYSRAGVAYMDGQPYAADVPRIRRMSVASAPGCATMNSLLACTEIGPNASLSPECVCNGALIVRDGSNGHVYGCADGWHLARLTTTPPVLSNVFATSQGSLVGFCQAIRGFKRSVDGGRTWFACAMIGGNNNGFSSQTYTLPYSCTEAAGCLWSGEYTIASPYPVLAGR